ncbi:MAG: ferrochelatase [Pseudomonadales bacterium]
MPESGYLLINLGTPASPEVADVRRYLNEFLMDPYVVSLPWPLRRMLVSGLILPFRPKRSSHAYRQIWSDRGSPLLFHSEDLSAALATALDAPVELAMRYGDPSIRSALDRLLAAGSEEIVVVPLYPQYADSTVTTSLQAVADCEVNVPVRIVPPFYQHPAFIQALHTVTAPLLDAPWDHILFSFHGLPEEHLKRADPTGSHCLAADDCCEVPSPCHATCYRHQARATASALANALGIKHTDYTVSFQSRLGRMPWLQPYTDQVLAALPERGIKRLVVACPAFVADNLETLEEIGLQGRETFLAAGGESFRLVPCLNAHPAWVEGLKNILTDQKVVANSLTSS